MREITLSMHDWCIQDATPYINIGKAGENNAVTIFLQGDDLIYTDETENRYVEYFLDICDENDILSANTQKFVESQDGQDNVIFSMPIMREFLGKEGVKLLQVRCIISNSNGEEIATYESNVFHAIVKRNSGFAYKYDLAYFQQLCNYIKTSVQQIIANLMNKTVYDSNDNGIVDNAEKVNNPLVIYNGDVEPLLYDGSEEIYIDITGSGGGGGTTNYNVLNNKPSINGNTLIGNKTNADLGIPTKTSDLTNDSHFVVDAHYVHTDNNYDTTAKNIVDGVTSALDGKVDKVDGKGLSTNDYTNADKAIVDGVTSALASKVNISDLASVATSGDYDDLINKPSIPNVSVTQILESGTKIAEIDVDGTTTDIYAPNGGSGTSDYNALSNRPSINNVVLSGNKSLSDLGINIPTKTSDLTNDSNFVVDANYTHTDNNYTNADKTIVSGVTDALALKANIADLADVATTGSYNDLTNKPTLGTASSKDVASSGDASATQVVKGDDSRLTNARPASDVYEWAKASTKPSYTKSEVGLGNVPNVTTNDQTVTYTDTSTLATLVSGEDMSTAFSKIKKAITDLIAHIGNTSNPHSVTAAQLNLATVATSGDYDDLIDKPTLATVATSGSYDDLIDKPSEPSISATANVDATSGTPTVVVTNTGTSSNPIFNFAFTGLKGTQGASGFETQTTYSDDTVTSYSILPNILYVFDYTATTLDITEDTTGLDPTKVNDYHFIFTSGATATVLTLPQDIVFPSDFSVDANYIYEISIVNDLLTYQKWESE